MGSAVAGHGSPSPLPMERGRVPTQCLLPFSSSPSPLLPLLCSPSNPSRRRQFSPDPGRFRPSPPPPATILNSPRPPLHRWTMEGAHEGVTWRRTARLGPERGGLLAARRLVPLSPAVARSTGGRQPPAADDDDDPVHLEAQVVGWPAVGLFRKNAPGQPGQRPKFVKMAVNDAPCLRKVGLEDCAGYDQLLHALQVKFYPTSPSSTNDEMKLVDVVNGTEYVHV